MWNVGAPHCFFLTPSIEVKQDFFSLKIKQFKGADPIPLNEHIMDVSEGSPSG